MEAADTLEGTTLNCFQYLIDLLSNTNIL